MDRMTTTLSDADTAWFDSTEFATIATIEPDGRPQLSVVWVSRDGDDILVSTVEGRRKHRNLTRRPARAPCCSRRGICRTRTSRSAERPR